MEEFFKSFKKVKKLGKGSYGNVYLVEKNGKRYALKVIKTRLKQGVESLKELDIMSRIKHPYINRAEKILSNIDDSKEKMKVGILMEPASKDLHGVLRDKKVKIPERLEILRQITSGLDFLHSANYFHMDLKPSNILMFGKDAKISDFGLALVTEEKDGEKVKEYPNRLMTVDHRSINVLQGDRNYTYADDVWSLGITFLELLAYGNPLFVDFHSRDYTKENVLKVYFKKLNSAVISKNLNLYLSHLEPDIRREAVNLISRMLSFSPQNRPTPREVLESPLFMKIYENGYLENATFYPPKSCDLYTYEGFDALVRISLRILISTETFFLAADLYQRSFAIRQPLVGKDETDYGNIVFHAALSLYMAIKMIEPYYPDKGKIAELSGNRFPKDLLSTGESLTINLLGGKIYSDNFFTNSSTKRRLLSSFELLRNCRVYRDVDLNEWKRMNDEEERNEGGFDKYIPFKDFIVSTKYYSNFEDSSDRSYIQKLYETD